MDPRIGRFTTEDTHWNTGNMIYGDNQVKWNEREQDLRDPLGLNTYTLVPDIRAIRQSGNLYVYCMGNPVIWTDPSGHFAAEAIAVTGAALSWNPIGIVLLFFAAALTAMTLVITTSSPSVMTESRQIALVEYHDLMRSCHAGPSFGSSTMSFSTSLDVMSVSSFFEISRSNPKDLEKGMSIRQKEAYSDFIHDYKREHGMPPNHNLPWYVLVELARQAMELFK